MTAAQLPQFFLAGAPKAGTTALHAALATHPDVHLSAVKEPKHYLTGGARPARAGQRGPGDAHSAREWVWRREDYLALFAGAPPGALRGESTPFYLWDTAAHARIAADVPGAKVIAVVRDPVDRAWSNWVHLRADGLEPQADFLAAVRAEPARTAAGWAPFWRYRDLGRYGAQLRALHRHLPPEQVLVLRYRQLVDSPRATLDRVADFLGIAPGLAHAVEAANVKPHVPDTARTRALGHLVRAGAAAGAHLPPQVWRQASRPLLAALHARRTPRPPLPVAVRQEVLEPLLDDIAVLEEVTGQSFEDWRADRGSGDFGSRRPAPSSA